MIILFKIMPRGFGVGIFMALSISALWAPLGHSSPPDCGRILERVPLRKMLKFYNPFSLPRKRVVEAVKLLGERFYTPSDKGAVVGIFGFSGEFAELNRLNSEFLTGKPFADGQRVFHFEVASPTDFIRSLENVYAASGPIHRLAILGHGGPGTIELGSDHLDVEWTRIHRRILKTLPDDLFVPGAEIVILSCNCAEGRVLNPNFGIDRIKYIFSQFVRGGAKIIASRWHVVADSSGFVESDVVLQTRRESADAVESLSKIERAKLFIFVCLKMIPILWVESIFDMVWLDEKSKFNPVDVIELPAIISTPNP